MPIMEVESNITDDKFFDDLEYMANTITELWEKDIISYESWDVAIEFFYTYIFKYEAPGKKIIISLNVEPDNSGRRCRITVDDEKIYYTDEFEIKVPVTSYCTNEDGKIMYNMYCRGHLGFINNVAVITGD